MKKHIIYCLLLILVCFTGTAFTAEIGGVTFSETMKAGTSQLVLNGVGLRKKFGFKVYAVGLYLKQKGSDNAKILNADEPMCLMMHFRRNAPVRKIKSVYYDSFASVLKPPKQDKYDETSDYGALTKKVVDFMTTLTKGKIHKNDIFTYKYIPGKGTEVYMDSKDNKGLQITIPGLEFKKALFSIWLIDGAPVGNKLKNQLLGK